MSVQNQTFVSRLDGNNKKVIYLEKGLMVPDGGPIKVEGTTLLQLTGGRIQSIQALIVNGSVYQYQILVVGKREVKMYFHDETNDKYSLSIDSPAMENHFVSYNSKGPSITYIKIEIKN